MDKLETQRAGLQSLEMGGDAERHEAQGTLMAASDRVLGWTMREGASVLHVGGTAEAARCFYWHFSRLHTYI